jgi:hypothetical protein
MQPVAAGGVYVNELGDDDGADRVRMATNVCRRLKRVRPDNLFRLTANVLPAAVSLPEGFASDSRPLSRAPLRAPFTWLASQCSLASFSAAPARRSSLLACRLKDRAITRVVGIHRRFVNTLLDYSNNCFIQVFKTV